ncbi:hypothetical protein ACJIZ3_010505 [Penstemon smallii]|uniref:Uncharacterized protein n=1 Tax=Penstemon smallii TaxID=265156 RepID=A0ABD3UJK1_9LAMI
MIESKLLKTSNPSSYSNNDKLDLKIITCLQLCITALSICPLISLPQYRPQSLLLFLDPELGQRNSSIYNFNYYSQLFNEDAIQEKTVQYIILTKERCPSIYLSMLTNLLQSAHFPKNSAVYYINYAINYASKV